jgi:hypothetical protein
MQCSCIIFPCVAARICNIIPHYLINTRFSREKNGYWTWNLWFDIPYNIFWNISHSNTNGWRYDQKFTLVSLIRTLLFCCVLMKFEFSWQIFRKILKYQIFMKIRGSIVVPCGRTDGWTDIQQDTQTNGNDAAKSHFTFMVPCIINDNTE